MQCDGRPPGAAGSEEPADPPSETAESFADEVRGSGSLASSGGRQPRPQGSGGKPPRLECQDRPSELSEKRFSRKRIIYLKGKKTNSGGHQPDPPLQTEPTGARAQPGALQAFCAAKVSLMLHRASSAGGERSGPKELQPRRDAEASGTDALDCAVPDELLNRIYLKNMMATLKQVATAKQHISSRCPDCNRKRAELAQSAFLKRRKTVLESLLLQEKIDEHLHTKDFITRIGEAHRDLPRLSDDPRIIWKRLKEKSQKRDSGFGRSDTEQKM